MRIQDWLAAGTSKIGTILTVDHPVVVEVAKLAGFDWYWIDAEHGRFNAASAATACAVLGDSVPAFIRVPDKAEPTIKRYLDAGAYGIIVPQVSSVADAREIARAALYPPLGQRSVGIARAHGFGKTFAEYLQERTYSILVQIETADGVLAVEEIVQETYVDAVIVGPYDLSGSFGVPGNVACAQVQDAIVTVLAACKRQGKPCGIFAGSADMGRTYVQQGFDLVAVALDTAVLGNAYRQLREALAPESSEN